MLTKPIDRACVDVINSTNDAELSLRHKMANFLALAKRSRDRLKHILAHGEGNELLVAQTRVCGACALDGGDDVVHETRDASMKHRTSRDCVDGATL